MPELIIMKLAMLVFISYCGYYKILTSWSMCTCIQSIMEGITDDCEGHFPAMAWG